MQQIHDKIEGPFSVNRDLAIHGIVTERTIVKAGSKLMLHGMITGDLVVEKGARATVHGMVNGAVVNQGGQVEIYGAVDSISDVSPNAKTIIKKGAVIRG